MFKLILNIFKLISLLFIIFYSLLNLMDYFCAECYGITCGENIAWGSPHKLENM